MRARRNPDPGLNDAGQIVPGASQTFASGINGAGQIVGMRRARRFG